jgi:hypothetical protein
MYSVNFIKEIERSDSLILVILGNLGHFRHSFMPLYQSGITGAEAKINMRK